MSGRISALRRFTASTLAVFIAAGASMPKGSVFRSVKADAAGSRKKIVLGLNGIDPPNLGTSTSKYWSGSYVWFGEYNGEPVRYRVLDPKSEDFGGKTMLLDCDTVIDFKEYQSDNYDEAGKKWDTCELRTWLNRNFFNMLTRGEQSAVFTSIKAEPAEKDASFDDLSESIFWTPLSGDKVFCLDALEVARPTYGYANTTLKDDTKLKKDSTRQTRTWWLRSEGVESSARPGQTTVGYIGYTGMISRSSPFFYGSMGISPALNIDRSKVLFTKLISGTFNEYKLSLMKYGVFIQEPIVTRTNNDLEFLFTSDSISKDDYISVLVTRGKYDSENAEIIDYEKINIGGFSKEHYGHFRLPVDYDPETDYVYLIEEERGDNHHSDIVTTPREINVPCYKLTYDANGGVGEMKEKRVIPNLNTINLDKCTFTYKDGYHFKNWNTKADGSGSSYKDGASITLTDNMTLYAQWAVDPVNYIDADGMEKTLTEYTLIESSDTGAEWNGGFYVVKGDVTINDTVNISKYSSLVLCDGAKLTVTANINGFLSTGPGLDIYGQSGQTGKLITNAESNYGICIGGLLNIYGGDITASGVNGITADEGISIYRGKVNVTASGGNAQGVFYSKKQISIFGGKVTASTTGSAVGFRTNERIVLGWTDPSDRISVCSIIINNSFRKDVVFDNSFIIDSKGTLATSENISGKTLNPAYKVQFIVDHNVYAEIGASAETGKVTKPADPAKEFYIFAGWYIGNKKFDFNKDKVSSDIILTAKWDDMTYYTPVAEVPATCTEKGKKAHYNGSDGKLYIKDGSSYKLVTDESTLVIPALGHDFKYVSDGAELTASCTRCTEKAALKIVKPTLTLVGGSGSANATLEGLAAFNKATGLNISEYDITYAGRDGTNYASSKTAPTAAGKYTASITVGGVFASVDYSIVLRGDVNNDGRVNMKDVVSLQRYINEWPEVIHKAAADLTGDNIINMKDLVALQRLVNGWTV